MVDAPTNLTYGLVTGKYYDTVLDGGDADHNPDYVASVGTVTFTPEVRSYKNLAIPATFTTKTVIGTIDAFGDLRDSQNALGVTLMATDNNDLSPKNWTYGVTVSVGGNVSNFSINVTGGSINDLTIVSPAASSAGTAVVVSSADRILAQQAAAAAAQSAIDAAAASGGLNTEAAQDVVGAMVSGSGYVQAVYNDAAGTLVVSSTAALTSALAALAPLASPVFTGSPTVPGYVTTTTYTTGLSGKSNTGHTHAQSEVTNLVSDLAARPLATGVAGIRIKSGGTWPARPTGYAVVISIGADPSPVDQVAGDVRWIPAP